MLQESTQSMTPTSNTPTTSVSNKNRSGRSQKNNDDLDNTLSTVASTLNKLVESHTTAQPVLKFKELHDHLDKALCELPLMDGMKLSIELMQRADDFVQTFKAQNTFQNMTFSENPN